MSLHTQHLSSLFYLMLMHSCVQGLQHICINVRWRQPSAFPNDEFLCTSFHFALSFDGDIHLINTTATHLHSYARETNV